MKLSTSPAPGSTTHGLSFSRSHSSFIRAAARRTPHINGEIRNGETNGFHFRPVFKSENTLRFFPFLRKKTAQIIDAFERTLIDEWQNISETAMRAAIRTSSEVWLRL